MKQCFTVPLPPSVNALHRAGNYSMYNSTAYQRWSIVAVRKFVDQGPVMWRGRLKLTLRVYVPTNSSDLDNRIKACQDLLIGRVCEDDRHVWKIEAEKFIDASHPRVEMEVSLIKETQSAGPNQAKRKASPPPAGGKKPANPPKRAGAKAARPGKLRVDATQGTGGAARSDGPRGVNHGRRGHQGGGSSAAKRPDDIPVVDPIGPNTRELAAASSRRR